MKLSELISAYGDDQVQFQTLDHCLKSLSVKGAVTTITFGTEQPATFDGTTKLGLVVWLDRERVKKIIADGGTATVSPEDTRP